MTARYVVECECGGEIPVELYEAGTRKPCPACGAAVRVPDSVSLQQAAGTRDPLLNAADRLARLAERSDPPFDGRCHGCGEPATVAFPVFVSVLHERHLADDGGVGLSPVGLKFRAPREIEEVRRGLLFPFCLCDACRPRFAAARRRGRLRRAGRWALISGLAVGWAAGVALAPEAVLRLTGAACSAVLLIVVGGATLGDGWKGTWTVRRWPPGVRPWIESIPGVADALVGEEEYRVTLGDERPIA